MPRSPAVIVAALIATAVAATPVPADHGAPAPARSEATTAYTGRVTSANLMGVTVTNYGFLGNNFVSRSPSMEYPLGTGFEHLVNGGLWIGARSVDGAGAFTGVTTACLDMTQGSSTAAATEFTPTSVGISARSRLPGSIFDPAAISDLDLFSDYDDLTPKRASNNPENHRPLGLRVRQVNYAFAQGRLSHVLFFRFVITSSGPTLTDLRVGLFTELASGPKNLYSTWPPSSSSGPGSWFRKAWLQYDGSQMLREHYCAAQPIPDGCNLDLVPYWAGVKLLTYPNSVLGTAFTLAAWPYGPGDANRDQDVERYALMGSGTIADLTQPDLMPQSGDPVEVLSLGPFASLAPGDSLVVGFALVGGSDIDDIQENARVAQQAWDSHFTDLPTPVQISLASVDARADRVAIAWQSPEPGMACSIERSAPGEDWSEIARLAADGTGRIAIEDRDVAAGSRYGYRLVVLEQGESVVLDEVWVDVPDDAALALHGWSPGPGPAGPRVALSLASAAPARLEVLDVGGRRVHAQRLDGLGPGRHEVTLDPRRALGSGVYFLRLTQDGRVATRRVAVVE